MNRFSQALVAAQRRLAHFRASSAADDADGPPDAAMPLANMGSAAAAAAAAGRRLAAAQARGRGLGSFCPDW